MRGSYISPRIEPIEINGDISILAGSPEPNVLENGDIQKTNNDDIGYGNASAAFAPRHHPFANDEE